MGDRRLRALSLTAVFLTWLTAVFGAAVVYDPSAGARYSDEDLAVLAVALVFALVGGGTAARLPVPAPCQCTRARVNGFRLSASGSWRA